MFAKTIIDSDAFLEMPLSTQALYFHLAMRGDDDGFINNPRKIQRMIGAADDDLKVLITKKFIIPFDSGIVVIKHWKIHNYIRGDRKKETVYPEEMSLLTEKGNGAYTLKSEEPLLLEEMPIDETKTDGGSIGGSTLKLSKDKLSKESPRQKAYRESSLPYSFEYKIRQAFYGSKCPVCGCAMRGSVDEAGVESDIRQPSIQHNKPISKGGKHELGNISVICHHCNITLQDKETGELNAKEVIKKWDEICASVKCRSNVGQMSVKCQHRIGEYSIGQESIVQDNYIESGKSTRFTPPTLQEVINYCAERGNNVDASRFIDFYESKGWMVGKNKMKDWKAAVRNWERTEPKKAESSFDVDDFFDAAINKSYGG